MSFISEVFATEPGFFIGSLHRFCRHLAITHAVGSVSTQKRGHARPGIVAVDACVALKKLVGDTVTHLPLDDRTGQVPGDIARPGEKVIVTMQASVCL